MPPNSALGLLLALLDEGFDKKAWHGPNLRGSVRRVDAATAAWRAGPDRKTIWEHVVHAAYWKYTIRRRLLGEKRGSFPLTGSNWFVRPDAAVHRLDWDEAWAADLKLLDHTHASLRAAVAGLSLAALDAVPKGSKYPNAYTIRGAALHDVYHAGQIQLLKRLCADAGGAVGMGEEMEF